jgi:hypothetical protein
MVSQDELGADYTLRTSQKRMAMLPLDGRQIQELQGEYLQLPIHQANVKVSTLSKGDFQNLLAGKTK